MRLLQTTGRGLAGPCIVVAAAFVTLAAQVPQQTQPTFRASTDVVQLDVTVLDRERRPIRGLTIKDFTVLEDGKPVPIVAVTPVDIPAPVEPSAPWLRDVAPDVVSNAQDPDRIVVIVLDDAHTGTNGDYWDPWILKTGIRIAKDVVNGLGSNDRAAVSFTFMGRAQNFTNDKARLLTAIDSFRPKDSPSMGPPLGCSYKGKGGCVVSTLLAVAAALPTSPPRRKVIIFVSQQGVALSMDQNSLEAPTNTLDEAQALFRTLQQANVTIYAFSPAGLSVFGGSDSSLRVIAEVTGGRAIVDTNAPWEEVPAVLAETSTYYLVGFQSARADGRFHKVDVRVNRPGATVLNRSGFFASKGAPATKPAKSPAKSASPIDAAIARGFPDNDVQLGVQTAVFAGRGQAPPFVTVVTSVRVPAPVRSTDRIELVATAFDKDWKSTGAHRQTVAVIPRVAAQAHTAELLSSLPLKPGRYELRVGASIADRAGSVFADVDVPDFTKAALSGSGMLLGIAGMVKDLPGIPVVPTARRSFAASEAIEAFVRFYQGGRQPLATVQVTTTVVNSTSQRVFGRTDAVVASSFTTDRGADYRFQLPLAALPAGEYLMTVEAAVAATKVTRQVRFSVTP
jgi:VWFA-related protein